MRAQLVGHTSTFRRQFSVGLLIIVGVSACGLLKKKGDTGPDAQVVAVPVVASIAPLVEVPAPVASVLPSAATTATGTIRTRTHTHTQTSTSTSTGTAITPSGPTPPPDPNPGPVPAPPPNPQPTATSSAAGPAPAAGGGLINPQCLTACQKSYQDCVTQSGSLSGMALITKCREVLTPCMSACSK